MEPLATFRLTDPGVPLIITSAMICGYNDTLFN